MQFAKQVFYNPLLRRSFRRIVWKTKRFLLDVIPDVLVIAIAVLILMQIWEWCFWR